MPALWQVLASRPELLVDHASAYVDLVVAEAGSTSAAWRRRAWLSALSLCATVVAAVLAGVSLMLWAVLPQLNQSGAWLLFATPVLPLIGAIWWMRASRRVTEVTPFCGVRQQLKNDMAMLRDTRAAVAP